MTAALCFGATGAQAKVIPLEIEVRRDGTTIVHRPGDVQRRLEGPSAEGASFGIFDRTSPRADAAAATAIVSVSAFIGSGGRIHDGPGERVSRTLLFRFDYHPSPDDTAAGRITEAVAPYEPGDWVEFRPKFVALVEGTTCGRGTTRQPA